MNNSIKGAALASIALAGVIYFGADNSSDPLRPSNLAKYPEGKTISVEAIPLGKGLKNKNVTQENIESTICSVEWLASRKQTDSELLFYRKKLLYYAGLNEDSSADKDAFSVSYIVPLELGGSTDEENMYLAPIKWVVQSGTDIEDLSLEHRELSISELNKSVCRNEMTLDDALSLINKK